MNFLSMGNVVIKLSTCSTKFLNFWCMFNLVFESCENLLVVPNLKLVGGLTVYFHMAQG